MHLTKYMEHVYLCGILWYIHLYNKSIYFTNEERVVAKGAKAFKLATTVYTIMRLTGKMNTKVAWLNSTPGLEFP
jgi:hypothetical protein